MVRSSSSHSFLTRLTGSQVNLENNCMELQETRIRRIESLKGAISKIIRLQIIKIFKLRDQKFFS
jgi:hypothetical protein